MKLKKIIDMVVLGTATVAGLAGYTGIAIAGISIYLTGKEVFDKDNEKG